MTEIPIEAQPLPVVVPIGIGDFSLSELLVEICNQIRRKFDHFGVIWFMFNSSIRKVIRLEKGYIFAYFLSNMFPEAVGVRR